MSDSNCCACGHKTSAHLNSGECVGCPCPGMTPPSILDLARAALADRNRGTPGPWFAQLDRNDQECLYDKSGDFWVALLPHQCVRSIELKQAENAAIIAAARTREPLLAEEVMRLTEALTKISAIRDSIVGMQGFNFSEHAYPIVAALKEAGFDGCGYDIARANLGTLIEQRDAAIGGRDDLAARLADAERERDEARKTRDAAQRPHPCAPARCPACEWTNVGLLNYGTTGESRWLCHGCAATALADTARAAPVDAATLRAANAELASELVELRKRVMSVAQERVIQAAVAWRDAMENGAGPHDPAVAATDARLCLLVDAMRSVDALKEPGQ